MLSYNAPNYNQYSMRDIIFISENGDMIQRIFSLIKRKENQFLSNANLFVHDESILHSNENFLRNAQYVNYNAPRYICILFSINLIISTKHLVLFLISYHISEKHEKFIFLSTITSLQDYNGIRIEKRCRFCSITFSIYSYPSPFPANVGLNVICRYDFNMYNIYICIEFGEHVIFIIQFSCHFIQITCLF